MKVVTEVLQVLLFRGFLLSCVVRMSLQVMIEQTCKFFVVVFCMRGIWANEASPTLTSILEIYITRACGYIYIMCVCVQENAWHPPEGKCHVLRRCHRTFWW